LLPRIGAGKVLRLVKRLLAGEVLLLNLRQHPSPVVRSVPIPSATVHCGGMPRNKYWAEER
jgi:hypothetical protein